MYSHLPTSNSIPSETPTRGRQSFNPLGLILIALSISIVIGMGARWYGEQVSLPRYCAQPEAALMRLQALITNPRPSGSRPRRPYLITAKLLFLVPRKANEAVQIYLARVREQLEVRCQ